MRLETYLDAYAKAYYKFEDGELGCRLMRQRDKFRQRILDRRLYVQDNIIATQPLDNRNQYWTIMEVTEKSKNQISEKPQNRCPICGSKSK